LELGVVEASSFTTLEYSEGDVQVLRDGREIGVLPGMEIMEKDVILTDEGTAVVKYLDDSVTRLANNTRVYVKELQRGNLAIDTKVKIFVNEGTVWSKVVNLYDSKSSFSIESDDVLTSAKRAAFNVKVDDGVTEVGVFNNSVEFLRMLIGLKLSMRKGFCEFRK